MVSNRWRIVTWPMLVAGMASPFLMDCGAAGLAKGLPGPAGQLAEAAAAAGDCPEMKVEALASYDFQAKLKDPKLSADVKAALIGTAQLQQIAADIDADLKGACGGIAKDLGKGGEFADASAACKAALDAIGEVKAKMGAKVSIAPDIQLPKCSASVGLMADCAAKCDVNVKGGAADVKCEGGEMSVSCEGKCEGKCEMSAAAACDGTCEGSCDADFKGTCTGTCDGKCDGKQGNAACKGECKGKCSSGGKGECKGKCGGSCQLKAGASCGGQCSGKCSGKASAPKCSGTVKPPEMSAQCKGQCDAQVSGKLECTPTKVSFKIEGSADAKASENFKATLEKNLPAIITVAVKMKDRVPALVANMTASIDGAKATVEGAASGSAAVKTFAAACVLKPIAPVLDVAGKLKANVNVSVNIQASASASGSASAGK
jgi:hypothetical protein